MVQRKKIHGARAQSNAGPPNGPRQLVGVRELTRTRAQGERREGALGCHPQGV